MRITRRLGKVLAQIGKSLSAEDDEAPAFHHDWISAANKPYLELVAEESHGYAWGALQGARLANHLAYLFDHSHYGETPGNWRVRNQARLILAMACAPGSVFR